MLKRKMVNKFKKIVAIEPVNLTADAEERLKAYADSVQMYRDMPENDEETVRRIGDADAVLVSFTTYIGANVLAQVPHVRYIGMCCSLYAEESANVDIKYAGEHGIKVAGVRDYGDRGVVEYVIYQLVRILHGYDYPSWSEKPLELTGLKIGIIGLGTSGGMTAEALSFMQAQVSYYSRTRKPDKEKQGIRYMELSKLLRENEVIITCLNKNVILLQEEEFQILGNRKIMMNTSIGPAADMTALKKWVSDPSNILCCDSKGAIGEIADEIMGQENVICMNGCSGKTAQSYELLTKKALENMEHFLAEQ